MPQLATSNSLHRFSQAANHSLPRLTRATQTTALSARKWFDICMPHVKHLLKLIFVSGPTQLISSRITIKCATYMVAMCAPALLACSLLTLPGLIFRSPQQHAYFYFAKVLEADPTRWMVLLLAGACALFSLAIPATMPAPEAQNHY